ncbi:tape measure protein [Orbus wheelerorum]|uniref:tape measure protein n=1 Tax=Orbus wheelerorum TaxID=3074111 RepID=UPI00370DCA08
MADRSVRIKLLADTSSYRSEMERASRLGNDYYKSAQNSSQRLTAYLNQNTTAFAGLNKNIQVATNALKGFAGAFIGGFAINGVVDMADSYGQMAQRIRNSLQSVEGDISNYQTVQSRLLETSIRNAKDLADSQELYIRSAESMKTLGYNTEQTLDFVESLSSAFTSNATASDKVKSSIDAINKAFVSGKVSAQEWQTLSAAMPNLAGQIANSLGKERDEIVKLGNAGKLSITQLTNGTIKSKDAFNALADSMDNTIKDGFVQLSNVFQSWIGEANQTNRVTATITSGMTYLAKNFDLVVNSGTALIALSLARYFGNLTTGIITSTAASAKQAIETRNVAIAQKEALTVNLANIQAEKQFVITTQASLAAQLKLAQTEQARNTIRLQMKANSAQIIALDKAETTSKLSLASATTQASLASAALNKAQGLLKSGLGLIGGPMGAAMLAGGALYYFMQKAEDAKSRALGLGEEVDKLAGSFDGLTDSQLELKRLELLDESKNLQEQIGFQTQWVDKLSKEYDNLIDRYSSWYSKWTTSEDSINGKRKDQLKATEVLNKLLKNQEKTKKAIQEIDDRRSGKILPKQEKSSDRSTPADTNLYDDQKKKLDGLILSTKLLTEYDKIHHEIVNGSLKELDPAQKKTLENLAKEIDLTKKREELKKSIKSLGTPLEKENAQYDASRKLIKESLTTGVIDHQKANEKLEQLEADHQIKMAQIKSNQAVSDIDNAVALVDPVQALENENAKKLALIQEFQQQGWLAEQQALALKEAANQEFEQNRIAAQWEIWRNQSEANEFLAASLEGLASSATSTISGLMSGTMNATEAMQNFANVILNQAIGSLVQMGLQQLQNMISAQTTSATVTAAQIAEASTLAAAYAPAAMQASIASYGAAATVGAASYTTAMGVMKATSLVGMAHDGIDNIPQEGTWLLQKGERVLSPNQNKDFSNLLSNGGSSSAQVIINNYGNDDIDVRKMDDRTIIDIAAKKGAEMGYQKVNESISSHTGGTWSALTQNTNTKAKL